MKPYRVALLRKQFPFIDRLEVSWKALSPKDAQTIEIKRGDRALLSRKGDWDEYHWSEGGHIDYTKFFAVVGEEIVEIESPGRYETGGGHWENWDADTIGEQLFSLGLTPNYVIEVVHNDTDDNGRGEETYRWIIYKMGRFDLLAYHQEMIDRAAAQIKAELAAACNV